MEQQNIIGIDPRSLVPEAMKLKKSEAKRS